MARQQTNIRLDSVPAFLNKHLDRRRAGTRKPTQAPDRGEYLVQRRRGKISLRLAVAHMRLVHQGMGTYTDEFGMPWYRDGNHIFRVTENLDWIEQQAVQEDIPAGQQKSQRAAQVQSDIPSYSGDGTHTISPSPNDLNPGDYELPQERGYGPPAPSNHRKRLRRKRKRRPSK